MNPFFPTGAVELLRHADQVDFNVLYSGRLSLEEARRVKRVARQNCLKLPDFVKLVRFERFWCCLLV